MKRWIILLFLLFLFPVQVQAKTLYLSVGETRSLPSGIKRKIGNRKIAKISGKPYFWNRSYLILSSGGAPIEVIRRYIQNQDA